MTLMQSIEKWVKELAADSTYLNIWIEKKVFFDMFRSSTGMELKDTKGFARNITTMQTTYHNLKSDWEYTSKNKKMYYFMIVDESRKEDYSMSLLSGEAKIKSLEDLKTHKNNTLVIPPPPSPQKPTTLSFKAPIVNTVVVPVAVPTPLPMLASANEQKKYPILATYRIPCDIENKDSEEEVKRVLAEIVRLFKDKEKELRFCHVGNGVPGRLVQIPTASSKRSFDRNERNSHWLASIVDGCKETAEWILESMADMHTDAFHEIGRRKGLIKKFQLTATEAASMWSEANVSARSSDIILRHLKAKFGYNIQIPKKQMHSFFGSITDIVKPVFGTYEYCGDTECKVPERVEYWTANVCEILKHDIKRLLQKNLNNESNSHNIFQPYGYHSTFFPHPQTAIDLVMGADHGAGRFRLIMKANLLSSLERRRNGHIEYGLREYTFGQIKCKKDNAEITYQVSAQVNDMIL